MFEAGAIVKCYVKLAIGNGWRYRRSRNSVGGKKRGILDYIPHLIEILEL